MPASVLISSRSDVVDIFLDGQLIQTGQRQAKKQTDPAIQSDESIAECLADGVLRAIDGGWIGNAPMRGIYMH